MCGVAVSASEQQASAWGRAGSGTGCASDLWDRWVGMRGKRALSLVCLSAGPGKGSRVRCAVCLSGAPTRGSGVALRCAWAGAARATGVWTAGGVRVSDAWDQGSVAERGRGLSLTGGTCCQRHRASARRCLQREALACWATGGKEGGGGGLGRSGVREEVGRVAKGFGFWFWVSGFLSYLLFSFLFSISNQTQTI